MAISHMTESDQYQKQNKDGVCESTRSILPFWPLWIGLLRVWEAWLTYHSKYMTSQILCLSDLLECTYVRMCVCVCVCACVCVCVCVCVC